MGLDDYRPLEAVSRDQRSQIARLQEELRSYIEIAMRLALNVQKRSTRLWFDHQDLIQKSSEYEEELKRHASGASEVDTLKTLLF